MDKPGDKMRLLSKVETGEELKVDKSEFEDEAVSNKELDDFQNNGMDGLVSGAGGLESSLSSAVFPEEVWEVILDHMVKSEDICNVLLAIPELDKAFQSKKAFWLFGAVLPHLMTKHLVVGKFKDVFNLRLVSKRWKSSVDSSLRSHVALQQLPLPPDSKEDHHKLMPSEHHFNYQCPQQSTFGASIFHTTHQFVDFLTVMIRPSGNPFPGKYVVVELSPFNFHLALALFEKFGEHVQHLEIKFNGGRLCYLQLCQSMLKCLSHLPNLRSLTFTGVLYTSAVEQTNFFLCKPEAINLFPDLPNLEAFTWQVDFEYDDDNLAPRFSLWITQLIQKYGRQDGFRKLAIRSHLYGNVSSSFPNLTELTLIGPTMDNTQLEFLRHALASLSNPLQLRKLSLHDVHWLHIKGSKLINYLADYKVESLVMKGIWLSEHENNAMTIDEDTPPPVATSIKSLYLTDDLKFSYDFFNWLPNLQFLTIHFKMEQIKERRGLDIMPDDSLARKIRGFVLKACDTDVETRGIERFSIWEELPKLEMFSVRVTQRSRNRNMKDSLWNFQFVRECGNKAFFSSKPDDKGTGLSEADDSDNDEDF